MGEIPLELQAKLLRAAQGGTFEAVGSDRTVRVDVRRSLPAAATWWWTLRGRWPRRSRRSSRSWRRSSAATSTVLRATGGKLYGPGGAAEILGINGSTLASRMRRLGLGGARDYR